MTNYREILRQYSLGLNKSQIAAACGYSRNTVAHAISLAEENGLSYPLPEACPTSSLQKYCILQVQQSL